MASFFSFFKSLVDFVTILLLFWVLGFFGQRHVRLSSPKLQDQTQTPALVNEVLTLDCQGSPQASNHDHYISKSKVGPNTKIT